MLIIDGFVREWVLFFLPPIFLLLGIFFWFGAKKRAKFLRIFGEEKERRFSIIQPVLVFLALTLLVTAMTGPFRFGTETKQGLRIILVIDNSWSMAADDYPCFSRKTQEGYCPDAARFSHLQKDLENLFNRFPKAEVGLITFAGSPYVWEARVTDTKTLSWIIRHWIGPGLVFVQGSNLPLALAEKYPCPTLDNSQAQCFGALGLAKEYFDSDVVVVVLSDGADLESFAESALAAVANEYRSSGIKILAVGYGQSSKEIQIKGKTIQANFDPRSLQILAQITEGEYRHSSNKDELVRVFEERSDFQRSFEERNVRQDLFQVFGAAGVILFLIAFFYIRR